VLSLLKTGSLKQNKQAKEEKTQMGKKMNIEALGSFLEEAKTADLLGLHNMIAGTDTKRFASRAAAVKRVNKTLAEGDENQIKLAVKDILGDKAAKALGGKAVPSKKPVVKKKKKKVVKTGEVNRRKVISCDPKDKVKGYRDGTKRAELIRLLGRKAGATIAECMKATEWNYKTCYEGIKLLNTYVGYGLEENEKSGKIKLVLPSVSPDAEAE